MGPQLLVPTKQAETISEPTYKKNKYKYNNIFKMFVCQVVTIERA